MCKISMLAAGCAAALFASTAVAQNPRDLPGERVVPPGEQTIPPAGQPDAPGERDRGDAFYRASEVLGTTVRSSDGQPLGQVQDLLIDGRSQQIRYFILGEGQAAQAQGSLTVVPWMAARPMIQGDQRFVDVRIEQQQLREAPTFTWQEIQTGPRQWTTRVNEFYGVPGQRPGVRGGIERDGAIEGQRPRSDRLPRGDRNIERERDGDLERRDPETRERDDRRGVPGPNVPPNVPPNDNTEVDNRSIPERAIERATEGNVENEDRAVPRDTQDEADDDQ